MHKAIPAEEISGYHFVTSGRQVCSWFKPRGVRPCLSMRKPDFERAEGKTQHCHISKDWPHGTLSSRSTYS